MNRVLALVLAIGLIAVAALGVSMAGLMTAQATSTINNVENNDGAKPQNYTTLMISGYGRVSYVPDRVTVVFVALGYGKNAADALSECSSKMSRIFSALESLGISRDSMRTSGINVNPRYDWEQKPPKLIDYEASYNLMVEISDISLAGKVIDAAFAAGADGMYGLQFTLSKERESELVNQAIKAAINDAVKKAEVAASQLGLKIVKIESISISHQQTPPPIIVRSTAETAMVPIVPGEGEITASVSLTISLSS
ncbi:MAG: SIMPL domain-containing protein [Thaumarchaeota archaeon]|jgi:uncharacterized protein YggE|nr:SIMPL domain-containing protein [Nitrososphaerota archaeon]MCL7386741.1 SIMPL domain-containing protein [Candidatus Wolframiiraptor allenii]